LVNRFIWSSDAGPLTVVDPFEPGPGPPPLKVWFRSLKRFLR
jgi:hypothetical protein